jgi:glycosyltransferase involved in cell wall biosynthesis
LPFVIDYDSKIELLLIGDGPLRKELVSLANELGITDKVKFIGRIAHEDVPKYIAASDIGIQSASEGGGLGNVVREIMAMRKPIVTANIHMQIKQVFVDQKCGLVISDPNDCRDLADKIIIYLSDEEERTIRAANAYNYIVQNASYPAVSKKWNKLLINLKHPDIEYSKN